MGIAIDEAIKSKIISYECANIIPRKCKCGCNLELNDSLRWLQCTSDNCKYKLRKEIEKLAFKIDLKLDKNNISKLIDTFNLISAYQILIIDESIKNDIPDINIDFNKLLEIRNKTYYIYEIVELCSDDLISKIAKSLFFGFDSFEEAYKEIEYAQVSFVNDRLGINNTDTLALSYHIYSILLQLKEQFIFIESQLNIKKYKGILNITFSDNTLPFTNKSEAIEFLNSTYKYSFCLRSIISSSIDILIKNSGENTNKVRIANLINNKYAADLMNNNKITLASINKLTDKDIKPLGAKIYITNLNNLIEHLNSIEEHYKYE